MPVRCADCDTHFLLTPDGMTVAAACPECGGSRLERDQPSPTHSDGALRDMVNMDTGQDQGGNPLQEGMLGGWQPANKRDESFASVKTAAHEITVTPGDRGIHHAVLSLLNRFHSITLDGHPVSQPDGEYNSDLFRRYGMDGVERTPVQVGAHHPAFAELASRIVQDASGVPKLFAPDAHDLMARIQSGEIPPPPKPQAEPTIVGPYQSAVPQMDFDLGNWDQTPTHSFIVTPSGHVHSAPYEVSHAQLAAQHGLINPDANHPMKGLSLGILNDNGDINFVQHETQHSPSALGQMLWGHFGHEVVVNPNLKPKTNDERWHGEGTNEADMARRQQQGINGQLEQAQLDLVPGRREERQRAQEERGRPFGYYNDPYINRGGSVTAAIGERTSSMEPYMPWTHEATVKNAGPALALLPALGIGAGEAAGGLLGAAAPYLMRGALMGAGSNAIHGLLGGDGPDAGPSFPPQPQSLQELAKTADLETPHSSPVLHDNPDGDTKQFEDQSTSTNPENPNKGDAGGPAGAVGEDGVGGGIGEEQPGMANFAPESPGIERMKMLLPLVQHYHNSEESGANDPLIRELHGLLESELPGYLDHADLAQPHAEQLLHKLREPDSVHAHTAAPVYQNTPIPAGQGQFGNGQMALTMQPGGGLPGVGTQGTCPYCGGTQDESGFCPQCQATAPPQGPNPVPRAPTAPPAAMPQMAPGGIPMQKTPGTFGKVAGDTQGPTTPEQIIAVQDFLMQNGRDEEVANVRRHPEMYARELAEIAKRPNVVPQIDPSQQPPPQPMQETAPPGATMPVPGMGAGTPGMSPTGSRKRSWHIAAPGDPNVIDAPAADQVHQRDVGQEQDSSHSWQDTGGQPLMTGQVYTLTNPRYTIPDIVRIEQIKPDSAVVTYLGQYQNTPSPDGQPGPKMNARVELPLQEVQTEGLTFDPAEDPASSAHEDYQDQTEPGPINTEPQQAPNVDQPAGQLRSHVEEPGRDEDSCPKCASEHISSSMSSPTNTFHECYRCGHGWETKEEDYGTTASATDLSWIMNDSGPGDDFFANYERVQGMREAGGMGGTKSLASIAAKDSRLQEIKDRLEANRVERTAGKKFSPQEQREFVNESGTARNSDLLDLDGTHYEVKYRSDLDKANGMNVPDEHMFMGL